MKKLLTLATACCLLFACGGRMSDPRTLDSTSTTKETPLPQTEFADARYTDMGKKALSQLSSGDMTGWLDGYAENAVYLWSSGDSLAGKTAIANYWKDRRSKVIDSIRFENDIWLPIKVNRPQKGPDVPGTWLLGWYEVHVKYKNGKKLVFWVHNDAHFNNEDKIDRFIQYIDRAPIVKAVGK